jgi:hypothetical protein
MVRISTEEYADLIRAKHALEMIVRQKEEFVYPFQMKMFDCIAGVDAPSAKARESEIDKIASNTAKVETPEDQIEEVWGNK